MNQKASEIIWLFIVPALLAVLLLGTWTLVVYYLPGEQIDSHCIVDEPTYPQNEQNSPVHTTENP